MPQPMISSQLIFTDAAPFAAGDEKGMDLQFPS